MIRLKSLRLRNWVRIAHDEITFPRAGMVVVLGSNQAGRGKLESVGSGKSSLGEAICRALLGVDGRYSSLGHYSLDEKGDTYVALEAVIDDTTPLTIELGYKCPELSRTGEGLRFSVGSNPPVERAHVRSTREELSRVVGVSPLVADWTVLLDGDRLKFNKLSQAEALDLLMQSLSQPAWQNCHELARQRHDQASRAVDAGAVKLDLARRSVDRSAAELKAAHGAVEDGEAAFRRLELDFNRRRDEHAEKVSRVTRRVSEAKESRKALRTEIDKINDDPSLEAAQSTAISEHQEAVKVLESHEKGWLDERTRLRGELSRVRHEYEHMVSVPGSCPTCKRAWDRKPSEAEIVKTRQAKEALESQLKEAETQVELCRHEITEHGQRVQRLRREQDAPRRKALEGPMARMRELEEQLELDERALDSLRGVAPRQPADNRPVLKAAVESCERRLKEAETAVKDAAAELAAAEKAQLLARYWVTAFSPQGLPNLALRAVIPPLNEAAKTTSVTMTGGVIDVTFESSVELASGVAKPQLTTKVRNAHGARRLNGNSKGEAGLTNLIIAETQAAVGQVHAKIGFRWFDEAVNSEDTVVRRSTYQYLKRQAAEKDILIFVVDHNPEAVQYADHILVANKGADGLTTFAWR